jgi:hypothetical protein
MDQRTRRVASLSEGNRSFAAREERGPPVRVHDEVVKFPLTSSARWCAAQTGNAEHESPLSATAKPARSSGPVRRVRPVSTEALSEDFVAAAVRQRETLLRGVEQLRAEAEALRARADELEARVALDERLLCELEDVLELAPQLRVDLQTEELRGQRLREVAIGILRNELGAGESIHYRDWFRLVRGAGHRVAGKDPMATFLTQVSRSDAVEPMGARSGRYRLRLAA